MSARHRGAIGVYEPEGFVAALSSLVIMIHWEA